jgi:hypothetical protein
MTAAPGDNARAANGPNTTATHCITAATFAQQLIGGTGVNTKRARSPQASATPTPCKLSADITEQDKITARCRCQSCAKAPAAAKVNS